MEIAPPNVPITFEVTFQVPGLFVAMTVYTTTTGSPILDVGPLAMTNVPGTNTYIANFTPAPNENYLILKAVYTDGTFATVDNDYGQGSETITTIGNSGGSSGSGCEVVGYVEPANSVVGFIETTDSVLGYVEC